jgi:thioesterase domain-containing protein
LRIWQKSFRTEKISVLDNFFELGGDSLLASTIFVDLERDFRRTYPLNILLKNGSIRQLARIISDPEAGETTPIIALRASGSRPPIFIFPGGVGDVLMLIGLADALGDDQPVYGMQAAGFFGKTVYSRRVEEAAAFFVQEIKKLRPTGPYHLAGHTFGGVMAFEVARQLREAGEAVGLVGLLDSHPPGSIHGGSFRRRMQTHLLNMSDLDWKGKLGYVTRHFQNRASKALGRFEFFQTILRNPAVKQVMWDDPFRQTRFAAANYAPSQPYPGPVTMFIVAERPAHIDWDVMAPWHKFISGPIERVTVPGDHSSMIKPPHVAELARLMNLSLQKMNPNSA